MDELDEDGYSHIGVTISFHLRVEGLRMKEARLSGTGASITTPSYCASDNLSRLNHLTKASIRTLIYYYLHRLLPYNLVLFPLKICTSDHRL